MDSTTIFAAAGIVGGWAVVHFLSQRRDRDKARRELIVKTCDTVSEQISKIMASGIRYHVAVARDVSLEIELNSVLKDLSAQLRLLNEVVRPKVDGVRSNALHKHLKQAITGQHYEDEYSVALDTADLQINVIIASASELRLYLAEIKFNQFV